MAPESGMEEEARCETVVFGCATIYPCCLMYTNNSIVYRKRALHPPNELLAAVITLFIALYNTD